jgi:hypothetical protein
MDAEVKVPTSGRSVIEEGQESSLSSPSIKAPSYVLPLLNNDTMTYTAKAR